MKVDQVLFYYKFSQIYEVRPFYCKVSSLLQIFAMKDKSPENTFLSYCIKIKAVLLYI